MTEPELEDLLRRYRPVGPPPDLQARVLSADTRRAWPWAAAAAALLTATLGLQFARAELQGSLGGDDTREREELQMLVEMLGGGDSAVDDARRLLWERQLTDLVEESRATGTRLER